MVAPGKSAWLTAGVLVLAAVSTRAGDESNGGEIRAGDSHRLAASKLVRAGKLSEAIVDLDAAIQETPRQADLYALRGEIDFRLANFKQSVADYDRQIQLAPDEAAGHWQRGISCYYAGKFDEGAKQFAAYHTRIDDNDVENSVWRCMCMTKQLGEHKARAEMLIVKNDRRVPMMEAYRLFKGELAPADVFKAAKANDVPGPERNRQMFYANLYVGLYYDSLGKTNDALKYLKIAADDHPIEHFMWTVAKVHAELLKKPATP